MQRVLNNLAYSLPLAALILVSLSAPDGSTFIIISVCAAVFLFQAAAYLMLSNWVEGFDRLDQVAHFSVMLITILFALAEYGLAPSEYFVIPVLTFVTAFYASMVKRMMSADFIGPDT